MPLTPRQRRFVEAYVGNATKAAAKAGYSAKTAYSQGQRMLKNVAIQTAIQAREAAHMESTISDRKERQVFLTRVMRDEEQGMPQRLKASELLSRIAGDFLDKVEHSGAVNGSATVQIYRIPDNGRG